MVRDQLLEFLSLSAKVEKFSDGWMTLESGQRVLDFVSQYGANPFGGTDESMNSAVKEFFERGEPALCQPLSTHHSLSLKRRLSELAGFGQDGQVFLTQSGAESVELGIKLARATTGRKAMIALERGFHGKTTGALQLTANADYRNFFGVENDFVRRLAVGTVDELRAAFETLVADGAVNAVMLELVQGEGGMVALERAWVQALATLAREHDLLLIVDEVQTGLGRLGVPLALEHFGIEPDVVLLSKALGGGLVPIGACVARPDLVPREFSVYHSSTFANNNFTSFVACAFLDRLDALSANSRVMGDYLGDALDQLVKDHPNVFSHVSGIGMMRGLHLKPCHDEMSYVANFFRDSGLVSYLIAGWLFRKESVLVMPCFSCTSCLRVQPPLNADRAFINRGIAGLSALGELLQRESGYLALLGDFESKSPCTVAMRPSFPSMRVRAIGHHRARFRRMQFNIHPLHARSYMNSLPGASNGLAPDTRKRFEERVGTLSDIASGFGAECYSMPELEFDGTIISGRLYAINLTAEQMLGLSPLERRKTVALIAESSTRYGADVIGLGAFTSVIAQGGFLLRGLDATVTAGSSLTAYSAVHQSLENPPLAYAENFGVVGASGSVGALCWQMLILAVAEGASVRSLSLLYNPANPRALGELSKTVTRSLRSWTAMSASVGASAPAVGLLGAIAAAFERGCERASRVSPEATLAAFSAAVAEVLGRNLICICSSDDHTALGGIDRFLLATNSPHGLESLYTGARDARLYDIGMPASVDGARMALNGCETYTAGLIAASKPRTLGHGNMVDLPDGTLLGCFAETLTLAATDSTAAPAGAVIKLAEALRVGELAASIDLSPTVLAVNTWKTSVDPSFRAPVDELAS